LLFAEQDLVIPPAPKEVQPPAAGDVRRIDERAIVVAPVVEGPRRRVEL
jgi:hypothetical protein